MDSSSELLTIGEVSRLTGRATSAIRYYEAIGLIPEAVRVNGRRQYPRAVIRTLAVIDTAQRAGLTLDEVRLLLEAAYDDAATIERLRAVAERKLPELQALIERVEVVRRWLEYAAGCTCPTLDDCPLFDEPSRLPERTPALRQVSEA
ncbi:MAG TPA: MerR family transcriptional regulator [Actinomycetes bacterium]|jgi:MerR family redox-sensitive transcriptional activator SoxR|nr:MerR family transcriptional regulator [Actinomycetes bacterium]